MSVNQIVMSFNCDFHYFPAFAESTAVAEVVSL